MFLCCLKLFTEHSLWQTDLDRWSQSEFLIFHGRRWGRKFSVWPFALRCVYLLVEQANYFLQPQKQNKSWINVGKRMYLNSVWTNFRLRISSAFAPLLWEEKISLAFNSTRLLTAENFWDWGASLEQVTRLATCWNQLKFVFWPQETIWRNCLCSFCSGTIEPKASHELLTTTINYICGWTIAHEYVETYPRTLTGPRTV